MQVACRSGCPDSGRIDQSGSCEALCEWIGEDPPRKCETAFLVIQAAAPAYSIRTPFGQDRRRKWATRKFW